MSGGEAVVQGTLKPDGTLELDQKPDLPPGRVTVILVSLPELPQDDPFWQRMQTIWEKQRARKFQPRSVQEVAVERQRMREEWEERLQRLEQLQAEVAIEHQTKEAGR
jgi:hypothetical protein